MKRTPIKKKSSKQSAIDRQLRKVYKEIDETRTEILKIEIKSIKEN